MLTDLMLVGVTGLAKILRGSSTSARISFAIFCLILVLLGITGLAVHEIVFLNKSPLQKAILPLSISTIIMGAFGLIVLGLSYASIDLLSLSSTVRDTIEIQGIQRQRAAIVDEVSGGSGGSSGDISHSIRLSLNELREYYVINKSQGRKSFGFSVLMVLAGFILISLGICILYFDKNASTTVAILTSIAGLLSQFIGATSFYLYRKTLDQLNHYFQQLTETQRIMLAIQLSGEASDVKSQDGLRRMIVASLLSAKPGLPMGSVNDETETDE